MRALLASPLGLLIGVSLGALGGGGSILAVPALVYAAGQTPKHATTTSLVLVAITALIGILPHWRAHRVRFGAGTLFGLVGIAGSLLGSRWNQAADPDLLLLAFAGLMFVAATAMWRRTSRPASPARSVWAPPPPPSRSRSLEPFDLATLLKSGRRGHRRRTPHRVLRRRWRIRHRPRTRARARLHHARSRRHLAAVITINSVVALSTRLQTRCHRMGHRHPVHPRQPPRRRRSAAVSPAPRTRRHCNDGSSSCSSPSPPTPRCTPHSPSCEPADSRARDTRPGIE